MITDTNGDIFPEGIYRFRVTEIPQETNIKGYQAWQWTFEAETEDGLCAYNERFMVWLMAPLLRGLGFMEISPGRFTWEPTDALHRLVTATIKHVTLDKGASAGKTVARMVEIVPLAATTPTPEKVTAGKAEEDIPF